MFFVILLFIISVTVNAQIKRKIEQVAGKEVKTKIWKGREIQFVRREVAVKIIPSATQTEINKLLETVGGRIINSFDKLGWGLIELPFDKDEILAVDDLLKLPFVTEAEPNMVTIVFLEPNDPYFQGTNPATYPYQWSLKNAGQTPPTGTNDADIDAPEAWNISTGSSDVIIAILDSGIPMLNGSLSHPDLDDPDKIILGPDYINDDNGIKDEYGHGTHVAGIAAAESNNGTGISGVAWNCKIMVIQVFGAYGSGTFSAFYNGVIYAVDYQRNNPGKKVVINFSGGGGASQQALDAVVYASTYGVPIIVMHSQSQDKSYKKRVETFSSCSIISVVSSIV
jgi:subtilisin family serine protease